MRLPNRQETGINIYANQWTGSSGMFNTVGGRPTERWGNHGGFTPGVTVLRGGVPQKNFKRQRDINHGTVLNRCDHLKPNLSREDRVLSVGWGHDHDNEREGRVGSFDHYAPTLRGGHARDVAVEQELNHGTVLYHSNNIKVNMDYEGQTQRPVNGHGQGERVGKVGGFQKGMIRFRGGTPRDMPVDQELEHGTVLYQSNTLHAEPHEQELNERGERLGSAGGFIHGEHEAKGGRFMYHTALAKDDLDLKCPTFCKDRHFERLGHRFVCAKVENKAATHAAVNAAASTSAPAASAVLAISEPSAVIPTSSFHPLPTAVGAC